MSVNLYIYSTVEPSQSSPLTQKVVFVCVHNKQNNPIQFVSSNPLVLNYYKPCSYFSVETIVISNK